MQNSDFLSININQLINMKMKKKTESEKGYNHSYDNIKLYIKR